MSMNMSRSFWAWTGFILSSCFYLYEFCLQVSPTVMTDSLMLNFKTTAVGVGMISGFYFYAYTLMQIPVGIIYDRYSTRLVLTAANFICALGTLIFITTNEITIACLGRFLMGFGSAFAFVAVIIFVNRWFAPVYFATLIGIAQLMSSIGAISAETPLVLFISRYGWKETMYVIALIGMVLGILTYLFANDGEATIPKESKTSWKLEKKKLCELLENKQTISIALYTFFIWAPITAFAGLWGVPFLKTVYHYSEYQASLFCIVIWLAIGIASTVAGIISDMMKNRKKVLAALALFGLIGSVSMIYFPNESGYLLVFNLSLIGIAAGGQALSFAVVNDNNLATHVGTASGINNMATVAGGAIFQPMIGYILKLSSHNQIANGLPLYSALDYQIAMSIVPICFLGSLIVSICSLKESYRS